MGDIGYRTSAYWSSQIEYDAGAEQVADHMRAMGYAVEKRASYDTGLVGLSRIVGATYEHGDGEAVGTVTLRLATYGDRRIEVETLTKEVETLTATLGHQMVGTRTAGGQVESVESESVERCTGEDWNVPVKYGVSGHALYPVTVDATIRVDFRYEPMIEVADG